MNLGDLQSRIVEQEENVSLKHLIFWDLPSTVAKPEREVSCQRYRLQGRSLSKRLEHSRKNVDKTKQNAKKFVRYQEGAEKYSMGLTKFTALAKEAKAVYKIDKVTLVNCEIFERYLESFRIP